MNHNNENELFEYLSNLIVEQIYPLIELKLDELFNQLSTVQKEEPIVLTNDDLKKMFQISDSTLNRLIKAVDFPKCWYGIRGHYPKDKILNWFEQHDYDSD
ncbi:DNA-binding protein [Listeria monocytogenes]|nr:DNA-binding protein [Listeria monocytogenes]EAC3367827.1 DNA-binding protein [Listeria monocytogenes]EAC7086927.1 DNA-binding protein [Listeria monocytogenes]EAC8542082.1 DNA-binding protein [Listeria monocytogenes]EAC8548084.1 DNA-binding protein [Listeria monocytogenes]